MKSIIVNICILLLHFKSFGQRTIDANAFQADLKMLSNPQLLDVRTIEEFNKGHLKGALQANWNDDVEFNKRIESLDKTKALYIYCQAGSRSAAAQEFLLEKGFKEVINLKGGINAWNQQHFIIEGKIEVLQLSEPEFLKMISKDKRVYVLFSTAYCPPCKKYVPTIDSLIASGEEVIKIDGASQHNLVSTKKVLEFPTILVYEKGIEIERFIGVQTIETLKK